MRINLAFLFIGIICGCHTSFQSQKSGDKFLSAEEKNIFTEVQKASFQYFWEGAEPTSGLGRERFHTDNIYPQNDKSTVTSGGAGFGVMAILAAIENKFITHEEGRKRLEKIVHFLETADRFHGAWPHWWNGETGKVKPFSKKDNGGDLVETSYMLQGLLCARQYFKEGNEKEKALAARMDALWKQVEFDWYRNGKNVLFWHTHGQVPPQNIFNPIAWANFIDAWKRGDFRKKK